MHIRLKIIIFLHQYTVSIKKKKLNLCVSVLEIVCACVHADLAGVDVSQNGAPSAVAEAVLHKRRSEQRYHWSLWPHHFILFCFPHTVTLHW
jgi:hypothetical protein